MRVLHAEPTQGISRADPEVQKGPGGAGGVARAGGPEPGPRGNDENIGSLVVFANANWFEKNKKLASSAWKS